MKNKYVFIDRTMPAAKFEELLEDYLIKGVFTDESKPYCDQRLCDVLRGFKNEGYQFKAALRTIFEVMRINPHEYTDMTFPATANQEWKTVLKKLDPYMTEGDMCF